MQHKEEGGLVGVELDGTNLMQHLVNAFGELRGQPRHEVSIQLHVAQRLHQVFSHKSRVGGVLGAGHFDVEQLHIRMLRVTILA